MQLDGLPLPVVGSYKEEITKAQTEMARDPRVCFIGYGIRYGRAGGTLKDVPEAQLIETPVAENLMMGIAIGLALKGRCPVVYIERFDFITNAMDAIVNHLDKMERISRGEFRPAVIIRALVGSQLRPLYTGSTHVQDFTEAMKRLVSFPVYRLNEAVDAAHQFRGAYLRQRTANPLSTLLVEYKDLM